MKFILNLIRKFDALCDYAIEMGIEPVDISHDPYL